MALWSKAPAYEKRQYSGIVVSTQKKQLLKHIGIACAGCPAQISALYFSQLLSNPSPGGTEGRQLFMQMLIFCQRRLLHDLAVPCSSHTFFRGVDLWPKNAGICAFLKFLMERLNEDQNHSGKFSAHPSLLQTLHCTKVPRKGPGLGECMWLDFSLKVL